MLIAIATEFSTGLIAGSLKTAKECEIQEIRSTIIYVARLLAAKGGCPPSTQRKLSSKVGLGAIADIAVDTTTQPMTLTVAPYWLALAVSLLLLVLMSGGLSMGGLRGVMGWSIFAFVLVAPIAL
jgi:hypothetical protein